MHKFNILYLCLLLFGVVLFESCQSQIDRSEYVDTVTNSRYFHNALDDLTDVIVHDIFSPPVASRIYAYPCIAAYETIVNGTNEDKTLAGQLRGLQPIPAPTDTINLSKEISALTAFYIVGKALIFSEDKLQKSADDYFRKLDSLDVPDKVITSSKLYGESVANHILAWADKDNYKQSRSFSKFSLSDDPARWKPTPPAYMEGIEPHWNKIRTMVLDSASQFKVAPPPDFDLAIGTEFRTRTEEVFKVCNNITEEQKAIASFWDCNPFVMNQTGHVMFATKKITPGGHWMGIANIAAETAELDLLQSIKSSALVSIALFDGFIACWDEKYRSSLVRPETVINQYIDEDWIPVLQTPPFPEHTSGHSVISTAASRVLTALHGDGFAFVDDVELKYGLPIRKFESFNKAASEAAISRLYGGIHFMAAITEGEKQGDKVGEHIIDNLNIQNID